MTVISFEPLHANHNQTHMPANLVIPVRISHEPGEGTFPRDVETPDPDKNSLQTGRPLLPVCNGQ